MTLSKTASMMYQYGRYQIDRGRCSNEGGPYHPEETPQNSWNIFSNIGVIMVLDNIDE